MVTKRSLENEPYQEPEANSSKRQRTVEESSSTHSPFEEKLVTIDMKSKYRSCMQQRH